MKRHFLISALSVLLISACGSGGGGSENPNPVTPSPETPKETISSEGKNYIANINFTYLSQNPIQFNNSDKLSQITVEGKTNLIGSVIGGGNTTLIRGELEYSDIHDKDKGYNFGISGSASFSKTDKMDGVANVVGGNAGNVIRDKHLEELFNIDKIRAQEEERIFYINKQKLNPFTAHSFIYVKS